MFGLAPMRPVLRPLHLLALILLLLSLHVQRASTQKQAGAAAGGGGGGGGTISKEEEYRKESQVRLANLTRTAQATSHTQDSFLSHPLDSSNDLFSISSEVKEDRHVFAASHHHHHSKHKKHKRKEG